jgi:hypothetical protein
LLTARMTAAAANDDFAGAIIPKLNLQFDF